MSGGKRFLVTGCRGLLGEALLRRLGADATGADLPELDVTDADSVRRAVDRYRPDWIVNCAAMTDVDACQLDPEAAFRVNARGVEVLATAGPRLLTVSTDHVFGGAPVPRRPIPETAAASPANVYGESKRAGELAALAVPGHIVVRTSWLFGGGSGLVPFLWRSLLERGTVTAVSDQEAAITYAADLAAAVERLMERGEGGIFHAVNPGGLTPYALAAVCSEWIGGTVVEAVWRDLGRPAPRPAYSVLGSVRGVEMPSAADALERWRGAHG